MATRTEPLVRGLKDLVPLVRRTQGLREAAAALGEGSAATLEGTWGSSCALALAALDEERRACISQRSAAPLVVVAAHLDDVESLAADVSTFSGREPLVFPPDDALGKAGSSGKGDDAVRSFSLHEGFAQRLRVLGRIGTQHHSARTAHSSPLVVTSIQALLQPLPDPDQLQTDTRTLHVGERLDADELRRWLIERGMTAVSAVELRGEFSLRGGILDVFAPAAQHPVRIELFGDEIESLRLFDPADQRSIEVVSSVAITALPPAGQAQPQTLDQPSKAHGLQPVGFRAPQHAASQISDAAHFCDYLPPGTCFALIEPADLQEEGRNYLRRLEDPRGFFSVESTLARLYRFPSITVSGIGGASLETTWRLHTESVEQFSGNVQRVRGELETALGPHETAIIACHNEAEKKRLLEVFASSPLMRQPSPSMGDAMRKPSLSMGEGSVGVESARPGLPPPQPSPSRGEGGRPPQRLRRRAEEARAGATGGRLYFDVGHVHAGFRLVETGVVVISDHELFHRTSLPRRPRRMQQARAIDSFLELTEGDYVVHVAHGIARYRGMELVKKDRLTEEHLILEFAEGTKVYVPVSKIELVQKYVGGTKTAPCLSKIGTTTWERSKRKVEAAVHDLASDMIELQALRESRPGVAYPGGTDWQQEFEAAFAYEETPDQLRSDDEIRADMQRPRPMDRLVCGDVGYGKTELAMRAAFRVVEAGKQVALLVPTTLLAEQHFRTFSERMAEFPFTIEVLSRFRTKAEQRDVLERLAAGAVDIVIGTHRLIQGDVQFRDLGLVIVDEEQRFGVEHKERLKALRATVDVLTLSATPIPRTLHMALLGLRDISNLETPPADRLAVETRVARFDPGLVRHAILRELNRGGQVYFVHNRVYDIAVVARRVQEAVPEANVTIAHGQMPEGQLEEAMIRFLHKKSDVLVATTIIESGLDIPSVNTIFIDEADRYGLADLHQLRGRVGRWKHRAYCYLLLEGDRILHQSAVRRLKAIEEFSHLGAGFKIAIRDLEIRGAGNILGTEQSGHIAAVGYELYCQLLENAVRRLKKQPLRSMLDVSIDLPGLAFLPAQYVPDARHKVDLYRRLARLSTLAELQELRAEMLDRFGPPPETARRLLDLAELRVLAKHWQIDDVHLEGHNPPDGRGLARSYAVFGYRNRRRIQELVATGRCTLRIADARSVYHPLPKAVAPDGRLVEHLKAVLQP